MQTTDAALARKKASLIGVCQAVGESFGFNPDFLRVALAVTLLISPEYVLLVYGILGVSVLLSRLLVRAPRRPSVVQAQSQPQEDVVAVRELKAA